MSIRKHGNRWQVRVRLGSGRRIERSLPVGATRADAQAFETRIRRQTIAAATGRVDHYTLSDAIDRWVETSAKSLKSWARDLKYRVPILQMYAEGQPLSALLDVADRIKTEGLKSGLTAAAINRYVALLRRVGNLAERWGWTDVPLGRRVVLLPENSQRHVYLTAKEVRALQAKADPVTADMIAFAVLTGLRRSEMLPLSADQVRNGVLVLDAKTKSGRPRGIPMPPEAIRIARKRLPWGVAYWELRDRFEAAREAAKMPHVHWHDLRHTYASWLAQAGKPLSAIRDLMGHSSISVTNRYSHLAPDHLRDAVDALPTLGVRVGTKRKGAKKVA